MEKKVQTHFLSLIVPVYKQEKTIVHNLKQIQAVLENIRYDYEIIVVVDGIVDKSLSRIRQSSLTKLSCYAYKENQGKSYAIRLGMQYAKGDYVMFIDSGMDIDPNGISMLLEHMEWYNADIIVGSKRHRASQVVYSWSRRILSNGYFAIVKLLFGIRVQDTQAGIKVYRKAVLQDLLPRLVEKKFAGDLELLALAFHLGYKRIYEAPIKLNYKLGSITAAATWRSILGIFTDTLAIYYRLSLLQYYRRKQNFRRFELPENLIIIQK